MEQWELPHMNLYLVNPLVKTFSGVHGTMILEEDVEDILQNTNLILTHNNLSSYSYSI